MAKVCSQFSLNLIQLVQSLRLAWCYNSSGGDVVLPTYITLSVCAQDDKLLVVVFHTTSSYLTGSL